MDLQIHKPIHEGDLENEFLNYIVKLYNDDELREDNWEEVAIKLNNMMSRNKNNKKFVNDTVDILKSVSTINIDDSKCDDDI